MGFAYMSGGFHLDGGLRSGLHDLGAPVVLREVADLDDAFAQGFLAAPLVVLLERDEARVAGKHAEVAAGLRHDLSFLYRLAQLLVDRLAGDGGEERGLESPRNVRLALRYVHAVGEAIARRARLERDRSAAVVARVERRAARRGERDKGPAADRRQRPARKEGQDGG